MRVRYSNVTKVERFRRNERLCLTSGPRDGRLEGHREPTPSDANNPIPAIRYLEWVIVNGFKDGKFLNALCQLAKGFEPTELGELAPPAQGLLIFVGEDVLRACRAGRWPVRVWDSDCTARFFASVAPRYGSIHCHAAPRAIPSDRLLPWPVPYRPYPELGLEMTRWNTEKRFSSVHHRSRGRRDQSRSIGSLRV